MDSRSIPSRSTSRSCVTLIAAVLAWISLPAAPAAWAIDFEAEIAPLLETHCLACHNADLAEGDVRLDLPTEAAAHLSPGDPEASRVLEQVSGAQPPMPKKGAPLTPVQVETLRRWIASGASWPEGRVLRDDPVRDLRWWSLLPINATAPPVTGDTHPVDAFLQAKLAEKGLVANGPADRLTLLRRLTFDLTGLPPTAEQLANFSLDRYDEMVDELLASPAFGEKWAQHWLDLTRYAETHGYDKDKLRNQAWPYRDYVIRSFNSDKPFDRFVKEQIAGDVLYPGEPDGVLGLGFLAAGPWDFIGHVEVGEGKIDGRIAKHLDRDEILSAVFNVFTSTTVQCAQCHHHKFDPVKMEDYYRLHAVFAAVDRADRVYEGLSAEQQRERDELTRSLQDLRGQRDAIEQEVRKAVTDQLGDLAETLALREASRNAEPPPQYGWHSQISPDPLAAKWVQVDLGQSHVIAQIRLIPAFDLFGGIGAGFGFPQQYHVEVSNDAEFAEATARRVFQVDESSHVLGRGRDVLIDVAGEPFRFIRVTATELAERQNDYIFALAELQAFAAPESTQGGPDGAASVTGVNRALGAAVTSLDSIEAGPRWGRANLTDGIYHRELDDPQALAELWDLRDQRARIEAEARTPERQTRSEQLKATVRELETRIAAFPVGQLVYAAANRFDPQGQFRPTEGTPRLIHKLLRGDIGSPAELMRPGMPPLWPGAVAEFELGDAAGGEAEGLARARLAEAIASPDNPLLWRSIANRVWQWTFGSPLVGTPNDFGRMGMTPTHPELLDYLASRLRDSPGQSLKALIRLLVTSDAYRRTSETQIANAQIDADNAYRWRANRRRLTAEEYRDAMLAVSGRLRREDRGGPSFQDFVIEKPEHSPHYEYQLHNPDDPAAHRRSVYRFVVRSQPQPFLTALDCADPSLSVAARDESTTSLQALAQWNNRLVEAMSRAFAERLTQADRDPVEFACRVALGRGPDSAERAVLEEHLRQHGPASLARVIFNLNAFVYLD